MLYNSRKVKGQGHLIQDVFAVRGQRLQGSKDTREDTSHVNVPMYSTVSRVKGHKISIRT